MRRIEHWGRFAAGLILSVLLLSPFAVQAQTWPQRPVKFIITLGAGSGVDITARMFADRLSKKWGQPVVVENRPGGDGIVAITAFLSANDDHVLLFTPASTFTAHPYLHEHLPYDPKALGPIARVSNTLVAIAVPATSKAQNIKELLDMARASPGKLNWASATGTNEFLFAGYLKENGLQMAKVPYKNTVEALNDLAESRIDMYIGAYAIVRAQAANGKVRILALTNRVHVPSLNIPNVTDAGVPGLAFDGLVGLFGPQSMPIELRERIAADMKAVAQDPDVVTKLTATGQVIAPGTAAEFSKAVAEQRADVDAVGRTLGVKPSK